MVTPISHSHEATYLGSVLTAPGDEAVAPAPAMVAQEQNPTEQLIVREPAGDSGGAANSPVPHSSWSPSLSASLATNPARSSATSPPTTAAEEPVKEEKGYFPPVTLSPASPPPVFNQDQASSAQTLDHKDESNPWHGHDKPEHPSSQPTEQLMEQQNEQVKDPITSPPTASSEQETNGGEGAADTDLTPAASKYTLVAKTTTEPEVSVEAPPVGDDTDHHERPAVSEKQERRKTGTGKGVVRRTLIFLDEGDESKRKSIMSVLSQQRQSRKTGGMSRVGPEMQSEFLDLLKRQSMHASRGVSAHAAMDILEGRQASSDQNENQNQNQNQNPNQDDNMSTLTKIAFPHKSAGSQSISHDDSDSMEQLDFNGPEYPKSPFRPSRRSRLTSAATRFTQSSYAGSIYSNNDDEPSFEANEHDVPPIPAAYRDEVSRQARSPQNHIEVTERADGSIVWQVVRGLVDRSSVYSTLNPRDSTTFDSERVSSWLLPPDLARRDSSDVEKDEREREDRKDDRRLSSSTLKDRDREDWRNFLASSRPKVKPTPVTDNSYNLPLPPTVPSAPAREASLSSSPDMKEVEEEFEHSSDPTANEAVATNDEDDADEDEDDGADEVDPDTHVIWTTDQDVAAMLESLARGTDSAKFEIKIDHQQRQAPVPAGSGSGLGSSHAPPAKSEEQTS